LADETIYEHLQREGITRRDFLEFCARLATTMGPPGAPPEQAWPGPVRQVARALKREPRLPAIYLDFQDCAGNGEAFTMSRARTVADMLLNRMALGYYELLSAASGSQLEEYKQEVIRRYPGKYAVIVEGSIPGGAGGGYCTIGGRSATSLLEDAARSAAVVIAYGNCAAFGGLPQAKPNPTGAMSVSDVLPNATVVNVAGCPAIPEVLTGTLAHLIVFGELPALDGLKRPEAFYGHHIHKQCVRRGFFDSGQFAASFDDDGARQGYCLYELGCRGPMTHNVCATLKWGEGLSYPIQSGHPCLGCSEPGFWDGGGFYREQKAAEHRREAVAVGGAS
jgi:hydrogenase small subunit